MELVRGCNARYAPEKTGRIRLCKASYYHDIEVAGPGIRDEKEGETRVAAEGRVSREGEGLLPEMTVTISDDEGVVGVAHLESESTRATFRQDVRIGVNVVPYIFCVSRRPESVEEERALKRAMGDEYDAWYVIRDADALQRELEKAIRGWLFDRDVKQHRLTWRHGWVSYYSGDRPQVAGDITIDRWEEDVARHVAWMEPWFNKREKYRAEAEYRYAFIVESPQLPAFPECMDLELTVSATRLFERIGAENGKIRKEWVERECRIL